VENKNYAIPIITVLNDVSTDFIVLYIHVCDFSMWSRKAVSLWFWWMQVSV